MGFMDSIPATCPERLFPLTGPLPSGECPAIEFCHLSGSLFLTGCFGTVNSGTDTPYSMILHSITTRSNPFLSSFGTGWMCSASPACGRTNSPRMYPETNNRRIEKKKKKSPLPTCALPLARVKARYHPRIGQAPTTSFGFWKKICPSCRCGRTIILWWNC